MDISWPIKPTTKGGKNYFITFIDDYSRKMRIFLFEKKSDAVLVFKKFKMAIEKKVDSTIKIIRNDQEEEYTFYEFSKFYEVHGIKRQFIIGYLPQQNRVVERRNRTIQNMVRSLLLRSDFPKEF